MWLSLVERCVRDAKAAGSNPVIPTRSGVRELSLTDTCFFDVADILPDKRHLRLAVVRVCAANIVCNEGVMLRKRGTVNVDEGFMAEYNV